MCSMYKLGHNWIYLQSDIFWTIFIRSNNCFFVVFFIALNKYGFKSGLAFMEI